MKTKNRSQKTILLLVLLFCQLGIITALAQPTSGPGIDPNALLLLDFENGDVSGWTKNTINRGEKVSVELMDAQKGDPVRFGRYAVKLNWDLTAAQTGTTLSCLYSPAGTAFTIPSAANPRKIGMWIYASPECEGNIWFRLQLFSPPGSTPGGGATVVSVFGNEIAYTYWKGWKYHEFDFPAGGANKALGPPSTTTPSYGMFRLLQAGSGTGGKQLTKGYFIIDNIRVTSATEDITKPTISTLTGNGTSLTGANFVTGQINFSTTFSDGTSGINVESIYFTVNGVLYKSGSTGFAADATSATITGLKLRNGTHTVVSYVEDKFGNIQTSTATFTVNDPNVVATTVTLAPDAQAHVGNVFEMKINTNNSKDIKELNISLELNQYASIDSTNGVVFAGSVTEGTYNYNSTNNQLTIHLKNDTTAPAVENLATIKVNISKNSNPDDVIRCTPILTNATYGDGTTEAFSLFTAFSRPVLATYNLTTLKRIVGVPGEVLVTDLSGNPIVGASVYAGPVSAQTGVDGIASFNFTASEQAVNMYAEKEGKYSYTFIVRTLTPMLSSTPSAIRSGTTVDPTTSKTITWMANPATAAVPSIMKIAKKLDGEGSFQQFTGVTKTLEFDAISSSGVAKGSKVTVNGLVPGTTYIYQVGDGTNWSATREFTTTTNTNKFSFSAFGDLQATGAADMAHWIAAASTLEAMDQKPFFSLNVGDIVDNDNNWSYHSQYSSLFNQRTDFANIDMTATYGNHEYMGTPNADIIKFLNGHPTLEPSDKYDITKVGDGTYASVYGNMLVIGLDWESKGGGYTALQRQTEQAKWLDEVLTNHADKMWKIITLHYEIPNTDFTPTSMATLGPILDKHHVQLVFCGHGHTFRRVQILNNVWTPTTYTRMAAPIAGAGTLHWQLGGMRPSDGNSQRWVFGEVDGNTIKFTVRDGSNAIVTNECFTLTAPIEEYPIIFNSVNGNGSLTATVDGAEITTGSQVQKGKNVVFTSTPNEGFQVKEWKINGVRVENTNASYTLSNLTGIATVTVEFEIATGVANSFDANIKLYPNPFLDVLNITGAENSVLKVMDIAGKKIFNQKISRNNEVIQLKKLSPGVYFFHIEKEKQEEIIRIVKR
ncbi:MAG TPA: metallophosphoesterase [Bacteroidales bacterium]|nr:metallophosphoesterase [Bacteroidales bacterium]